MRTIGRSLTAAMLTSALLIAGAVVSAAAPAESHPRSPASRAVTAQTDLAVSTVRVADVATATQDRSASRPVALANPRTPPSPSPSAGLANNQPVGVAPGDYLLTVRVTSSALPSVPGTVFQYEGGTGVGDRVAQFHASPAGTTVQAEVRVTAPSDRFNVLSSGAAIVSSLTLTQATWSSLVRGTKITSPTSDNVIWHGVNSNPDMPIPLGIQALAYYTRANVVRVPVSELNWLPYFSTAYVPAYRQQIIDTVNATTQAGMTAIVDLHLAGHDSATFNPGYSAEGQLGPDQHSLTFWKDAATLWGNNPNVIFELFNEPRLMAADIEPGGRTGAQVWRDGGTLTYGPYTWTAPGAQQLADTIRATGAHNLILIDGTDWAADLLPVETNPVDGTNLAYAFHAYTDDGEDPTVVPSHLNRTVAPVIDPAGPYRFASLATEFATPLQDGPAGSPQLGSGFLTSTATWMANHGVGWLVWGWYPSDYDPFGLLMWFPMRLTSRGRTVMNLM